MNRLNHTDARRSEAPAGPRRGFTLIELLVVISIIGVLAGLLLPAINGAVRAAKESAVASEITLMEQALASFKTRMGDYPPSFVVIDETGNYANNPALMRDLTTHFQARGFTNQNAALAQAQKVAERSQRYMKKFFNRASQYQDLNGDDLFSVYGFLEGDECLVFFLGGIPRKTIDQASSLATFELTGFNKNPAGPLFGMDDNETLDTQNKIFKDPTFQLDPRNTNTKSRDTPFFEFKAERLVDFDGDGFPSYIDSLGTQEESRPYVYFSSYGSNSYDPQDCNFNGSIQTDPSMSDTMELDSGLNYAQSFGGSAGGSISPNPYTTGPAAPTGRSPAWQKPQSYQIISAGSDRKFGCGGQFAGKTKGEPLPDVGFLFSPTNGQLNPVSGLRSTESDNITNFSQGRLN